MNNLTPLWVYILGTPLLWMTVTVLVYVCSLRIVGVLRSNPCVNPILISTVTLIILLKMTHTSYATYFQGAQFVHFMLGPSTLAIAVPIYRNRKLLTRLFFPILVALTGGAITGSVSGLLIGVLFGLPRGLLIAIAPKSVTGGVAMAITARMGGVPSITMLLVVTAGIFGAIVVTPLMNILKINDYAGRGFAVGVAAHGVGTARAYTVHPTAGLFAAVGMGLNAIASAIAIPIVLKLLL
ncbi:LrgB family protein [Gluconobacter sp. Dm-44]|uniref:LrgB family protein n=1 Tax=Gluconobacter sp. Dm-44 TaxID=2799805 RepID=UPI001B8B9A3C|nr:LrgB family protein [Gluconobacter sp. Dm-44]MBS1061264.1 LrgB family protein [Gluconobacter sp. Dm-44]